MVQTIVIPMNEDTKTDLEDCFVNDANMDASKYLFGLVRELCQFAKRFNRQQTIPVQTRDENGTPKQIDFSIKDINLEDFTLPSNPDWIPPSLEGQNVSPVKLRVGDTTMRYLKIFGQMTMIRKREGDKHEDEYMNKRLQEMRDSKAPEQSIKQWQDYQQTEKQKRDDLHPTCLEHAIFLNVIAKMEQKLNELDSKIFNEEYEEINAPAKSEPVAAKPAMAGARQNLKKL